MHVRRLRYSTGTGIVDRLYVKKNYQNRSIPIYTLYHTMWFIDGIRSMVPVQCSCDLDTACYLAGGKR